MDLIWTSVYDKCSGSMKITTHLDHISHYTTASDTIWAKRWTYRIFGINTRRDEIVWLIILSFEKLEIFELGRVWSTLVVPRAESRHTQRREYPTLVRLHPSNVVCGAESMHRVRARIQGS